MKKIQRRSFLAGMAAASAAPWVWIPKKAFAAATPGFGTAKRVLILYAGGGLRSAPLFNADVSLQHNPFGKATSVAPGTEWSPGTLLGTQPVDLFSFDTPTVLPPVSAISNEITVLAGVDHDPLGMSFTEHGRGDLGVTGGDPDGRNGLLSMLHRDVIGAPLPPFDIGLSTFGRGEGDLSAFRPIAVQSASEFTGKSEGVTPASAEWARQLRDQRDQRFIAKRAPHVRPYLGAARDAKLNSKAYAAMLHDPALDLVGAPEAARGGFSNQQLLEVLGANGFNPDMGNWGNEVAFALRLLQLGVPAVSVMRYVYDTHSDEDMTLPIDGGDIGRQIAGLHWLLHRMTDVNGNLLWNDTVVLLVSECSRDNTSASTGFNSAKGSDHQGTPPARNQCWPIFGGPITARGKRIGALDPLTLEPVGGPATSVQSVMATVLDVMGVDSTRHFSAAPLASLFT